MKQKTELLIIWITV